MKRERKGRREKEGRKGGRGKGKEKSISIGTSAKKALAHNKKCFFS